jgi:hypothetical protein
VNGLVPLVLLELTLSVLTILNGKGNIMKDSDSIFKNIKIIEIDDKKIIEEPTKIWQTLLQCVLEKQLRTKEQVHGTIASTTVKQESRGKKINLQPIKPFRSSHVMERRTD